MEPHIHRIWREARGVSLVEFDQSLSQVLGFCVTDRKRIGIEFALA